MCVCVCPKKNPSSRLPSLPSCCAPMLQRLFALQAAERLMLFLHACEVRGEGSACVCTMELRLVLFLHACCEVKRGGGACVCTMDLRFMLFLHACEVRRAPH